MPHEPAGEMNATSGSGHGTVQPHCNAVRAKILCFLLHRGDFSDYFMHLIARLLNIDQLSPLMNTCQSMYTKDAVLYLTPKRWNNDQEVRKVVRVMMTMSPRWNICTSNVRSLKLGVVDWRGNTRVVRDDWVRFIVSSGKFPKLTSINLSCCENITNASVFAIAKNCPQLVSINLDKCAYISNASVIAIAHECPQLKSISLDLSRSITDTGITAIARGCPELRSINLRWSTITDASIVAIARGCSRLRSINLYRCRQLSDTCVIEIAHRCPRLAFINLNYCKKVTDAGKNALRQGCPDLDCTTGFVYKRDYRYVYDVYR